MQTARTRRRRTDTLQVSPDPMIRVTDAVLDKVRDGHHGRWIGCLPSSSSTLCGSKSVTLIAAVQTKAVCVAPGVSRDGVRGGSGCGALTTKAPNSGCR